MYISIAFRELYMFRKSQQNDSNFLSRKKLSTTILWYSDRSRATRIHVNHMGWSPVTSTHLYSSKTRVLSHKIAMPHHLNCFNRAPPLLHSKRWICTRYLTSRPFAKQQSNFRSSSHFSAMFHLEPSRTVIVFRVLPPFFCNLSSESFTK